MELQIVLNSFASDVFRRQADCDYISARASYRMQLRQQFLWAAQQAVEKYLKAILLFNGKSCRYCQSLDAKKPKEFGNNLTLLNNEVKSIEYLNYSLPDWAEQFILYLTELGGFNRYLSKSSYSARDALHKIDELIWCIRRYCQYIPDRGFGCKDPVQGLKEAYVNMINNPKWIEKPASFQITSGELEKVLKKPKSHPARQALVWANLHYGSRSRKIVHFTSASSSEVPPNERYWYSDEKYKKIISQYIKI